jgi:hypothetical protein
MLIAEGRSPAYSPTGHLLFTQGGTLLGVPFDLKSLETRGEPVALMDGLEHAGTGTETGFALSRDGTLLYRPAGRSEAEGDPRQYDVLLHFDEEVKRKLSR